MDLLRNQMSDPVFELVRKMVESVPERPTQPPHHQNVPQDVFDEWDNDLMQVICGKRLAKPIQDLLILASQADDTEDSFGMNANKFVVMVLPMLRQLREACKDEFNDL